MFTTFTGRFLPITKFVGFIYYRNYSHEWIEKNIYTPFLIKVLRKIGKVKYLHSQIMYCPYSEGETEMPSKKKTILRGQENFARHSMLHKSTRKNCMKTVING